MNSVELFAGAGGMALGLSNAGFRHLAVVEWDSKACQTIRENQNRGLEPIVDWPLYEMDVRQFRHDEICEPVDVLAGGPPCQPFSLGGKHRGYRDSRDMFPEVVRAVRELQPKALLIENVRGLIRRSFIKYFEYILLQLTYPDLVKRNAEDWLGHLGRLERHHTGRSFNGLSYRVLFRLLNAADYGVPQRRERVFIVGFRSDLQVNWCFPSPTHSLDALLFDQWVTGEYWERHGIARKNRPPAPSKHLTRVLGIQHPMPREKPWQTVRDCISDLPAPERQGPVTTVSNHQYNPGARVYPGHTGSPLDEPAKTLKAGDHGVPGGENMLAYPDGRVRYFTVRESARLQAFPDNYFFCGSWTENMRQLGNAVPVALAQMIAVELRKHLSTPSLRETAHGNANVRSLRQEAPWNECGQGSA